MDVKVVERLAECLGTSEPVALVTVIANTGSSPGKAGAMMTVQADKRIIGTVGGGNLEHQAALEAVSCLVTGKSKEVSYTLEAGSDLGMNCGGELRIFIKVFLPEARLVVVGAGHIGSELYQLGVHQGFRVVVIDDRADMLTQEKFPKAERIVKEDLGGALTEYNLDKHCFVAIATRSHEADRLVLEAVVKSSDVSYMGMIGSRKKIINTYKYLLGQGVSREKVAAIYAPMGLNIASVKPKEIALSIMSEILLVKNNGSLEHMRTVKSVPI